MKRIIIAAVLTVLVSLFVMTMLGGCSAPAPIAPVVPEASIVVPEVPKEVLPVTAQSVSACLYKVYNRGVIPLSLVQDVVAALRETDLQVFAPNNNYDIYSSVSMELGPYTSLKNRAAVMGNVMLVEAAFESSFKYGEGRDQSASNTSACTEEAGLYQTSGNMNTFNSEASAVLVPFQKTYCGATTCEEFKRCTKKPVKAFVHGHFIRASRITVQHWGPIRRKEINPWLKTSCVKQIQSLL